MTAKFWPIIPVAAPRQSRREVWKPSPATIKYRAFRDEIAARKVWKPESGDLVVFFMPIPKSWTKKRKAADLGHPHTQRPDVDNLLKALLDASYGEDSHIWAISAAKVWGDRPGIYIERRDPLIEIPCMIE